MTMLVRLRWRRWCRSSCRSLTSGCRPVLKSQALDRDVETAVDVEDAIRELAVDDGDRGASPAIVMLLVMSTSPSVSLYVPVAARRTVAPPGL